MRPGNAGSSTSSVTADTHKIARRSRTSGAAGAPFNCHVSRRRNDPRTSFLGARALQSAHVVVPTSPNEPPARRAAPTSRHPPLGMRDILAAGSARWALARAPTVAVRHITATPPPSSCAETDPRRARRPRVHRSVRRPPARTSGAGADLTSVSALISKIGLAAGCFEQELPAALVAFEEHLEPRQPITSALMPQLAGARREASFRLGQPLRACAPAVFPKSCSRVPRGVALGRPRGGRCRCTRGHVASDSCGAHEPRHGDAAVRLRAPGEEGPFGSAHVSW
jgi:hypothetical protein